MKLDFLQIFVRYSSKYYQNVAKHNIYADFDK